MENHSCGSNCGCNHNHEEQFMTLVIEGDKELKCSVLDIFSLDNDRNYIALLPVGQDEVLLYRYIQHENEEFELKNIETDEEFEEAEDAFFDIFNEDLFEDLEDLEDLEEGNFDDEE